MPRSSLPWRVAYYLLLAVWLSAGLLAALHRNGNWLTSYGDDLAIPAWLYIAARNLHAARPTLLHRTLGRSPLLAFAAIALASSLTEISQYFYPRGLFPGTFDPLDFAAYLLGAGLPYAAELLTRPRGSPTPPSA